MSKKKESPNKYERASENLREFLESNHESIEKSGKAIKKLSDKVNELSDKANEPIQYYPIESVCVGDVFEPPVLNFKDKKAYVKDWLDVIDGRSELANKNYKLVECECVLPSTNLIQEDANPATKSPTKCSSKNCCKDDIKMLRKELSDLRRSYNGYRGAMKQADRERDVLIKNLKSRDEFFDMIMQDVSLLKRQMACTADSGFYEHLSSIENSIFVLKRKMDWNEPSVLSDSIKSTNNHVSFLYKRIGRLDDTISNINSERDSEPTSLFRKRYLIWFMVGCIAALSIALILAYLK